NSTAVDNRETNGRLRRAVGRMAIRLTATASMSEMPVPIQIQETCFCAPAHASGRGKPSEAEAGLVVTQNVRAEALTYRVVVGQ
ncbi:MAG TPA: hypothetical protein VGN16_15025, partial [Acidobacteriaceae bacterium]